MRRMRAWVPLVLTLAGCGVYLPPPDDDPPTCLADAECGEGYACEGAKCVVVDTPECTLNTDCPTGTICENGNCVLEAVNVVVVDPMDDPNAYMCGCTCSGGGTPTANIELEVCVPPELNPNIGGATATPAQLQEDCQERVEHTVEEMAEDCGSSRIDCDCELPTTPPELSFRMECNTACVGVPLEEDCSNWDIAGEKTANHTTDTEPVCLAQNVDPPAPIPDPLARALLGRASVCEIDGGNANVQLDDEDPLTPAVHGRVLIGGDPCPGGSCDVTLSYTTRIDPVEFDVGLFGLGTAEIDQLTLGGASQPEAVGLDASGDGILPIARALNSARGHSEDPDEDQAIWGQNRRPFDVGVHWAAETCSLAGDVATLSEDDSTLSISVAVTGTITNQPPAADAGDDQTVECEGTTGTEVELDCDSTDPDNNVLLTQWHYDNRGGDELGAAATVTTTQTLGSRTYHCLVIDGGFQAAEDTVDVVVEDSTPPVVTCGTPSSGVMRPRDVPLSFTATATDVCAGPLTPAISDLRCEFTNGAGKIIDKGESCVVSASGDTVTVTDSGGVGTRILWSAGVSDGNGNDTTVDCGVTIVNKL